MRLRDLIPPRRCGRKTKTRPGGTCTQYAMHGQTVCRMHGGMAPQSRDKADELMRALVHPAIASMKRQIENDEFPAARFVLEWAGFKTPDRVESTGHQIIEVEFIARPRLELNGAADPSA